MKRRRCYQTGLPKTSSPTSLLAARHRCFGKAGGAVLRRRMASEIMSHRRSSRRRGPVRAVATRPAGYGRVQAHGRQYRHRLR